MATKWEELHYHKVNKSPMENVDKDQLWKVINENTKLQQENYMLKNKLKQIEKLVINYDIYE